MHRPTSGARDSRKGCDDWWATLKVDNGKYGAALLWFCIGCVNVLQEPCEEDVERAHVEIAGGLLLFKIAARGRSAFLKMGEIDLA